MDTLYKVSSTDGGIIWRLNGKMSDFQVDPKAVFAFQHNARWLDVDEQTRLTVFDNGPEGNIGYSRGLLMDVDQNAKTAKLMTTFINGPKTFAEFEGNVQQLSPGNATSNFFLGYGSEPYFAEFTSDGDILIDGQFAKTNAANGYRTYRFNWTGMPLTNPDVKFDKPNGQVYLSWNGATEVDRWVGRSPTLSPRVIRLTNQQEVYTSNQVNSSTWTNITTVPKNGFETKVDISKAKNIKKFVRGKAIDQQGNHLGWSGADDGTTVFPAANITTPNDGVDGSSSMSSSTMKPTKTPSASMTAATGSMTASASATGSTQKGAASSLTTTMSWTPAFAVLACLLALW